jgi:hypothetical protein
MVAYIALLIRHYPDLLCSYIWLQSVEHGLTRTEKAAGMQETRCSKLPAPPAHRQSTQ